MPWYDYLYGFAKSTYGIFQHSSQWFSLGFNDQVIYLDETKKKEKDGVIQKDSDVAVYFIHGTGDHACSFQKIAGRLKRYGLHSDITSFHLVSFDGRYQGKGVDVFAKQLLEKIQENGHKRIILCGHSRGGVLAAWFNQYLAREAGIEVLHCISICGPFRGSYLAISPLTFFSDSVDQMSKGSEFLSELREKVNTDPNSPYTFVIASLDDIVPNRSGYILEYIDKYPDALFKLEDHGHISIMTSTRLSQFLQKLMNDAVSPVVEKGITVEDP